MAKSIQETTAEKQARQSAECTKSQGNPPAGKVWRVYGNVCVPEKALPGGTTGSDLLNATNRAYRVNPETGERDRSLQLEQAKAEQEAAAAAKEARKQRLKYMKPMSVAHFASNVLRYPESPMINPDSDYVAFSFYEYAPPFKQRERQGASTGAGYVDYNQASEYTPLKGSKVVLLYMPEDVSTGYKAAWGGKAFSNIGRGAMTSAGASGLDKLTAASAESVEAAERFPAMAGAAALRKAISKISGDSLSYNDVFGSISGAILNPNTELLFESTEMRNFTLKYKLVPRNTAESGNIRMIIDTFKEIMLPRMSIQGPVFGMSNNGLNNGFIGVPHLCRVSFMKGSGEHPHLPKFKMCAITQVDVNYTPDGAYATYYDGNPVAIELTLSFQETKLIYSEDIKAGF